MADGDEIAPLPGTFASVALTWQLTGHQAAEHEILSAWNSGRFHHGWLICGPRGIGKATFACRIARFLLAQNGQGLADSLDIPRDHPLWRQLAQGAHPDFRLVEREWDDKRKRKRGEIVVDNVRGIGSFLSRTAGNGGWRVVLVDAADEMNRNAANALLKVLEEPPANTVLLLLAHNPARLLPTIRSRCRRLLLRPLPADDLCQLLCEKVPQLSADDAHSLALLSEGSVGQALELQRAGGLHHYQGMVSLLRSLPRLDVPALHTFLDESLKGEDGFRTTSALFLWWLGRMISAGGRGISPPEVVPGENGLLRTMLAAAPLDRWGEVWEKVSGLFERVEPVSLDKKQALLSAFMTVERTTRPSRG